MRSYGWRLLLAKIATQDGHQFGLTAPHQPPSNRLRNRSLPRSSFQTSASRTQRNGRAVAFANSSITVDHACYTPNCGDRSLPIPTWDHSVGRCLGEASPQPLDTPA